MRHEVMKIVNWQAPPENAAQEAQVVSETSTGKVGFWTGSAWYMLQRAQDVEGVLTFGSAKIKNVKFSDLTPTEDGHGATLATGLKLPAGALSYLSVVRIVTPFHNAVTNNGLLADAGTSGQADAFFAGENFSQAPIIYPVSAASPSSFTEAAEIVVHVKTHNNNEDWADVDAGEFSALFVWIDAGI